MQNHQQWKVAVLATAVALAATGLQAQAYENNSSPSQNQRSGRERNSEHQYGRSGMSSSQQGQAIMASKVIGKEVKNDQGERLGEVKDLILSPGFNSVQYAILSHGGTLGVGEKRIAIPASELNFSGDQVTLNATKQELDNASTSPSGAWMSVSGEDWTRNIDAYYGQPNPLQRGRFEREPMGSTESGRQSVRGETSQGAGARKMMNSTDQDTLKQNINQTLRQRFPATTAQNVDVSINNGTVTLTGTVANESEKRDIESQVKNIPGVSDVENQLNVKNK